MYGAKFAQLLNLPEKVQAIGDAPSVLAIDFPRSLQHPLRRLDGLRRFPCGDVNAGEFGANVERPAPEPARIGKLDAGANPFQQFGQGSVLAWAYIVVHILGMTFVVPPAEETFYRSFVYRNIVCVLADPDLYRFGAGTPLP